MTAASSIRFTQFGNLKDLFEGSENNPHGTNLDSFFKSVTCKRHLSIIFFVLHHFQALQITQIVKKNYLFPPICVENISPEL